MIMFESEAHGKWCPFARAIGYGDDLDMFSTEHGPVAGVNRMYDSKLEEGRAHGHCMCIASKCMAWQWHLMGQVVGDDDAKGYCCLCDRA
jgi:hypothetical protein